MRQPTSRLRLRQHRTLSFARVAKFGELVGLAEFDLRVWCLPKLREVGMVEYSQGASDGLFDQERLQVQVSYGHAEEVQFLAVYFGPEPGRWKILSGTNGH